MMRRFCNVRFGQKVVSPQEKQKLVNQVFTSVAEKYDLMNDLMSMGVHRLWKDEFVADMGNLFQQLPLKFLDVAGGTGDIAFRIVNKLKQDTPSYLAKKQLWELTIADISAEMLEVGRKRAEEQGFQLKYQVANAESLPFEENQFDYYTISFGIRNVPNMQNAINEAFRVLKPGGRFMCLEFSRVQLQGFDQLYSWYSHLVIPNLGTLVAGDRESYQYLVESIEQFPPQEEFAKMISDGGFSHVTHRNLSYGIAAIHSGVKL